VPSSWAGVLTNEPPQVAPKQDEHLTFTFVSDGIEAAVAQATAAAGEKAVQVVGGVSVTRQLLQAGLVDELHIDVMPVFLGAGLRFLDNADLERVELEKIDVREVGVRTSLRFRVKK
jgi:dihydrofolate reductase